MFSSVFLGLTKAGLTRAQAGSLYIHVTCISVLLGTAAIAPWKGPPWATAERVDSDKRSCASCQDMCTGSGGQSNDRVPVGPGDLHILHSSILGHLPVDRKVQFLHVSPFQMLVNWTLRAKKVNVETVSRFVTVEIIHAHHVTRREITIVGTVSEKVSCFFRAVVFF